MSKIICETFPDYCLMRTDERALLQKYAAGKKVLELGSYYGMSAKLMAEAGALEILCVDTFECENVPGVEHHSTLLDFMKNTKHFANIRFLPLNTKEAYIYIPNHYFDMLFIDADHSYEGCLHDLIHYWFKVKRGGLIALHDYSDQFLGVKQAASVFFDDNMIDRQNSLAIWRKPL